MNKILKVNLKCWGGLEDTYATLKFTKHKHIEGFYLLYLQVPPPPLGCFCINAFSRISLSMAAGQRYPSSLCSSHSLSVSLSYTAEEVELSRILDNPGGCALREFPSAPVRLCPTAEMTGKGRQWNGATITPNKWKWKHCKVHSCKFHMSFPIHKDCF